ncbi:MAG TPA: thioredoxin domain-containing protein [Actinomycetota bacterium]
MNRLAGETSPYLLQHAGNPVDWSPWDEEALRRARTEDRPIFLSIGYSACHWCHVMERESFEDEETAAFLNAHFVPIKVDREERPDLDAIYMDAVQAMTGQGGWPLSAFLTPDGRPFFAGTYFPKEAGRGLPSFRQVLDAITEAWRTQRADVEEQGTQILEALSRAAAMGAASDVLTEEITHEAFATIGRSFDERWGGFGAAPKFPQPMILEFVLRMAVRGVEGAREMLTTTLDRMAAGGIHDQLGGGFARYSTDATWHVPHFEKMLYDNAQLAQVYTRAWLVTREDRYQRVATQILDYLIREMRHPEGGFFSSQDADSEGVEGKFFSWTWDELVSLVGAEIAGSLGARAEGNWDGTNVLWFPDGMPPEGDLSEARAILVAERETRVRPATDDKILTAWNAMAIQALAVAGRAFGRSDLLEAATTAADFAEKHLADPDGRLLRSWRDGVRGRPGFCDDHALLASALLTLFGATGDVHRFNEAARLVQTMIDLFADQERGGFFQTARDADPLVVRPKDVYDNAVPSGNSAAAEVLLKLSLLTGDPEMERMGIEAIGILRHALSRAPMGFGHALSALDLSLGPAHQIAIVGAPRDPATDALVDVVLKDRYLPNMVLAVAAPDDEEATTVPLLRNRPQLDGDPTAYVCQGFVCTRPTIDPATLGRQLDETNRGDAGASGTPTLDKVT